MNAVFDSIAAQYDKNRGGEARGQRFAAALLPFIDTDQKVLDMGVGTGLVSGQLERLGCEVIGIDISSEMLKRAVGSARSLIWSDMSTLQFLDGYFGSVYSIWSMHLVDDIAFSLGEIRRVLTDGGRFVNCAAANIVTSPPKDRAGQILAEMQSALRTNQAWHDTAEDLERLSEAAHFSYEKTFELSNVYQTSISQMLEQMENKAMLTLQMATPEQLQDIVEPTLAKLRELPEPDAPIRRDRVHQFSVLQAV